MNFAIAIVYAREGRRPVAVAKLQDQELLGAVAEKVLLEAEIAATSLMKHDPILAMLQNQELDKLRRVLSPLLR
jgi:hypothetical protein